MSVDLLHKSNIFFMVPLVEVHWDDSDTEYDSDHKDNLCENPPLQTVAPTPSLVVHHPMMEGFPSLGVTVTTLKHMFSRETIWERSHIFACYILGLSPSSLRSVKSHALYKGMRKMCYKLLRDEYNVIKRNIRLLQRRKPSNTGSGRPRRPRPLSKYAVFCREMRATHAHAEIVGQLQSMWKQKKAAEKEKEREAREKEKPSIIALKRPVANQEEDETSEDSDDDKDN